MNQSSLISVIMNVYNVDTYVGAAIESILGQTYSNLELIIMDDASTDDTYSICEMYKNKDGRIELHKNKINLGIEKTLNIMLSFVKGKYVVHVDGDDISDYRRLEIMKDYLDANHSISLVGTSTKTINKFGNIIGKMNFLNSQALIQKTIALQVPVAHIWMTYKSVYDQLKGYREFRGAEDYDFILRAITSGMIVSNISDYYGYSVRINREGNSSDLYGVSKFKSKRYVVRLYKERLKAGIDSFSVETTSKFVTAWKFTDAIFRFSNRCFYKAMEKKSNKQYIAFLGWFFISLISPYQILYLYERLRYNLIVKKGI